MAAPTARAPPVKVHPLSTSAGAVLLSAVVVTAGALVLVASQGAASDVGVVEVTVTVEVTDVPDDQPAQAGDPVRLPHCAGVQLRRTPLELHVWNPGLPDGTANVVLVHYRGMGSFSGGGDDTQVFFLRPGERARIVAAHAQQVLLYEVVPGGTPPLVPAAATMVAEHSLEARYLVNSTSDPWGPPRQTGVSEILEAHAAEAFGGVKVVREGPLMCA